VNGGDGGAHGATAAGQELAHHAALVEGPDLGAHHLVGLVPLSGQEHGVAGAGQLEGPGHGLPAGR
jgi:hypothetical protein